MCKRLVLFAFSTFLYQGVLFAQSIYSEGGVNTWTRLKYTHNNASNYTSEHFSSRSRNELGVRKILSKKIAAYGGISHDEYAYLLKWVAPNQQVQGLYELEYFGANLGLDYLVLQKQKWGAYLDGAFSRKTLRQGVRSTVKIINNAEPEFSSKNLLLDANFPKVKFDVSIGFKLTYQVANWVFLYSKYHISQSLRVVESGVESYDFLSHDLSFGIALDIKQWNLKTHHSKSLVHKEELVANALIENSEVSEEELLFLKDSNRVKIYFPPNEFQFYPSHINAMTELAEFLLKVPEVKYQITGYYDRFSGKDNATQRVESILAFFWHKGVPVEQFVIEYDEVYDEYSSATNVWNRRVELIKIN